MTVGIIGAMEEEIIHLKSNMEVLNTRNIIGTQFFAGKIGGCNVVLVRCGIGKVNAAVCTQVLVDLYGVDCVINTGVAGSMVSNVNLGDVVISTDLVQHDFDTSVFENDPVGYIPRLGVRFFEADKKLVGLADSCAKEVLENSGIKHFTGRIASGDQFITDGNIKEKIARTFSPLCVEMEGASIAHACYLNDIPYVVIRAISDNSDGDTKTFDDYVHIAAKNSSSIVLKIISGINA